MQNKKAINELNMDLQTYKKVSGKLNPQEKASVTITGDRPNTNTSTTSMATMEENDAVIEPQDKATIKYLSNVKDSKTGEISQPFTIADKNYQMIRGKASTGEIVMAVYCHDDINENGENLIHSIEDFENNIANPMKERLEMGGQSINNESDDYVGEEREHHDRENLMDFLNLADLVGYKHFFVNIKTGDVTSKFRNTKEMIKSGIKLGPDEDYMDIKQLKSFRFGGYFKNDINEETPMDSAEGTNVNKLQSDVKKLTGLIKNKFSVYLAKLDKPIEQAQFLSSMATEIGVPLNKLSSLINTFKDIAKDGQIDNVNATGMVAERKVLTKQELEESISSKKVIKTIKKKDL